MSSPGNRAVGMLVSVARSLSPVPATLPLADVRRINVVRERLLHALRTADTLPGMRAAVAELASDLQDAFNPAPEVDTAAPTERTPASHRPWDDASAPSTPRNSVLGEEFGV